MSMKICKQIGYFLPKDRAPDVLVADVRDRVAEAAEDSSLFDGLLCFVEEALERRTGLTVVERALLPLQAAKLVSLYDEGSIDAWQLVKNVISHDQHEGFLFCDAESECRHNSRIDFLEQSSNPEDWYFKAQTLKVPAHSWGGYRPVGAITPELAKLLDEGVRLPRGMESLLIRMMENDEDPQDLRYLRALDRFNDLFHPEVDPLSSILAEKLGLIKEGVSIQEFEEALVPSILTTWS